MLLQRLAVAVESRGEHVVLGIGTSRWTLHYETALLLSWRMRSAAQAASRFAGDFSRHWGVMGTLQDAENPDAGQPFTPGKVYPVNRDVVPLGRTAVASEGALVLLRLGRDEARIPYQGARVIAQWIRLRAKESKCRTGDRARHWSKIVHPNAALE